MFNNHQDPDYDSRLHQDLRRAIMIEQWVEKHNDYGVSAHLNCSSSSSDSSSGGIFSSSEAESCHKTKSRSRCSRQGRSDKCMQRITDNQKQQQKQPMRESGNGGFTKTKLKALKIYGELKKVKQPISPGGRITSFLNSIFNSNAKKVKLCSVGAMEDVGFERKSKSTCSSATSFSRSCLSKSSSSSTRGKHGKSSNGETRRSVRFHPVSVIVDEDCRPCGHKSIYENDPSLMPTPTVHKTLKEELKAYAMEKEAGVDRVARDYLRKYQKKQEFSLRSQVEHHENEEDEDGGEDALSYSSSDLFELDHLIGIGRYREELPVYETTNLKTNQAIANGLIL